jgi:hypothetical protein
MGSRMRSTLSTAALAVFVAAAVVGCGGGGDSAKSPPAGDVTKIGQLLDQFQSAAAQRNGAAMCSLFTQTLVKRVEQQAGKKCVDALPERLGDPYSVIVVRDVTIDPAISRAGAQVVEKGGQQARIFLVKQADEWLVDTIRRPGIGTPLP